MSNLAHTPSLSVTISVQTTIFVKPLSDLMEPITVRVHRRSGGAPAISPYQYGQFIEYLCDMVPGMWADMLEDGSFEGLTPYAFEFIKETDFRPRPWYPIGAVHRMRVTPDESAPVQGKRCLIVEALPGPDAVVGIAQDGLPVRKSRRYRFSSFIRSSDSVRTVTVSLFERHRRLALAQLTPTREWHEVSCELAPRADAEAASLAIEFTGPGFLALDCASLMPDDSIGGWRADVVAALRALNPGVVRFGGSVVDYPSYGDYDWRKTVGPISERSPFRSWGGLQPAAAGLEEIIQLIQAAGAEPLICVRFNGSTPEEAAKQVEYFNGDAESPMGRLRARNGHPEPYGVRFWQIGNEVRSDAYDRGVARFARAMKAADPCVSLLGSYPTEAVVRTGAGLLDFVCPHHYACDDLEQTERDIQSVRRTIAEHAPGSGMRIAVTEWNTTAGDWGLTRGRLWTLANALACARYHHLLHRNADIVHIANRSNLANSFCSGIIQTDGARMFRTPTYYAQQLYATTAGRTPLVHTTDRHADLDISATYSSRRRKIAMFIVNDGEDDTLVRIDLAHVGIIGGRLSVTTVGDTASAGQPDVSNSFSQPRRVFPNQRQDDVRTASPVIQCPALSITLAEWTPASV